MLLFNNKNNINLGNFMNIQKREHLLNLLTQKKVSVSENLHQNIKEWLVENKDDFPLFLKKSIINGKIQDIKFLLSLPYHIEYNLLKPYSLRNEADPKILSLLLEEIKNNPAYNKKSPLEWFTTIDQYGGSPLASSITRKNIELINLMTEEMTSNINIDSVKIFNSICYILNNDIKDFYYTEINNRKDTLKALDDFINKHKIIFNSFSSSLENKDYKETDFSYIFSEYRGYGFQFLNHLIDNMNSEGKLDIYKKIIKPYEESIKKPNKDMVTIFKQLKNIKLEDFPLDDYISKNVYSTLINKILNNKKIKNYLNDNPKTISNLFINITKDRIIKYYHDLNFPYQEAYNFINHLESSLTAKSKSFLSQNNDYNILNILDSLEPFSCTKNTNFMISLLLVKNFKLYNPEEVHFYEVENKFISSYLRSAQEISFLEKDIPEDVKEHFAKKDIFSVILKNEYLKNIQNIPDHTFSYLLLESNFNDLKLIKNTFDIFEDKSSFLQAIKSNNEIKIKQHLEKILETSLYFKLYDIAEESDENEKSEVFFYSLKESYNKLHLLGFNIEKNMFYDIANKLILDFKNTEHYTQTKEELLFEKEVIEFGMKNIIQPTKKNRL